MRVCPDCGDRLQRIRRSPMQKLAYADVFRCQACARRIARPHATFVSNADFVFSRYTRCIRCGTRDVHRLTKRDGIDPMSRNLLSVFFRLMRAPIHRCRGCRLQYCDWRPLAPKGSGPSG